MLDLFEKEQQVYESALARLKVIELDGVCQPEDYAYIVKEYGKVLRQLRRMNRIFDRSTVTSHATQEELKNKVNYDALTGIYNRRFLDEILKRFMDNTTLSGGLVGVLMLDIDYFKKYNDTYGHDAGDKTLREVAKALKSCVRRSNDFAARYGGEEFSIVLVNTDQDGIEVMCQRANKAVRKLGIAHEKSDVAPHVTVSIGASLVITDKVSDYKEVVKRADEALYQSKKTGRDKYTFLPMEY